MPARVTPMKEWPDEGMARMMEGIADEFRTTDEDEAATGGFTASPAFPALVALWFAALFGGGCLFLPPVLFDAVFGGTAPFGPNTRIIVALGAAGIGLLMGLFIASRVRGSPDEREERAPATTRKPTRKRRSKRDAPKPLDVRSALGLDPDYDDDDELAMPRPEAGEEDELELSDEAIEDVEPGVARPPIDDPYFASAWSDSDTYDQLDAQRDPRHREPGDAAWCPSPPPRPEPFQERASKVDEWEMDAVPEHPQPSPSRYNPFADFVSSDDALEDDLDVSDDGGEPERAEQSAHRFSEDPAPQQHSPRAPAPHPERLRATAPPPPPAWPIPRTEEPKLQDLGVAELVERLARALQGQQEAQEREQAEVPPRTQAPIAPPRSGEHRHDSALAPRKSQDNDVDRALRGALDRLSRLDDVA